MIKPIITTFTFDHMRRGFEYDWLAVDIHGHLGFFSTAGEGPIPLELCGRESDELAVFEKLYALPRVSGAVMCEKFTHDIGDWVAMAERGIYAFDWRRERNDFCLVAYPQESSKHIGLRLVPDDLKSYVVHLAVEYKETSRA